MAPPQTQTALIQSENAESFPGALPLAISNSQPGPSLPSPHHVLVRVRAVALNPNDHKMVEHFPVPGNGAGCDFCGVIEHMGDAVEAPFALGTRVCGTVFPYAATGGDGDHRPMGAFAEWLVADSRLVLRIPDDWSDLQGAALGGVGWSTVGLALSHPDALALPGLPSRPAERRLPVLVYGGGTATGTMACQLLKLSGYSPIAVTQSPASAALALRYGAVTAHTVTPDPTSGPVPVSVSDAPIRHVLDCITDADSAAFCIGAIARTGGRYACLERCRDAWRTRRVVKVKEVMGYEVLGDAVDIGGPSSVYTRAASPEAVAIGMQWAAEMQTLLDWRLIEAHHVEEVPGRWEGILAGLGKLQRGEVKGRKLVVRISE